MAAHRFFSKECPASLFQVKFMFRLTLANWLRCRRPVPARHRQKSSRSGPRIEAFEERIVLSYVGSFRVPKDDGSGRVKAQPTHYTYSYGGDVSAVDGNEMWLGAHVHHLMVGKISIPTAVKPTHSDAFSELPIARALAPAIDITGGLRNAAVQNTDRSMVLGDLQPEGDQVRWVFHDYYNVTQKKYRVFGTHDKTTRIAEGPYGLYEADGDYVRDQLSGRYLTTVPPQWAGAVGGTIASGGGGLPGQASLGAGPSLYAYTPPPAGADPLTTRLTATPLLEYPFDDNLPIEERRSLEGWNRASQPYDGVWIGDTVVFAARFGIGEVWYGGPDGPGDLYDWYIPDKTYHAERYEMRLLFYRAADFERVAKGEMEPWQPKPYANVLMPNLMGPKTVSQVANVSLSWDAASQRLYIVQTRVDRTRSFYERHPVVHVYDLSGDDGLKRWIASLEGKTRSPILMKPTLVSGSTQTTSGITLTSTSSSLTSLATNQEGAKSTIKETPVRQPTLVKPPIALDNSNKDNGTPLSDDDKRETLWSLESETMLQSLNQTR